MKLLSINVGLPQEIDWRGDNVRTPIFKAPVGVPVHVTRLNVQTAPQVTRLSSSLGTRKGARWRISPTCSWQMRRTRTSCAAQAICPHFRKAGGFTSASDSGNRTLDRGTARRRDP